MPSDQIRLHNGQIYSGMPVGGVHNWNYHDTAWSETKMTPELWKFRFDAIKSRTVPAPINSGVEVKSAYHWLVVADQQVIKISKDDYQTAMQGLKFKIGHKRPYWKKFSYGYKGQIPYKQKVINSLLQVVEQLQQEVQAELGQDIGNLLLDSY